MKIKNKNNQPPSQKQKFKLINQQLVLKKKQNKQFYN